MTTSSVAQPRFVFARRESWADRDRQHHHSRHWAVEFSVAVSVQLWRGSANHRNALQCCGYAEGFPDQERCSQLGAGPSPVKTHACSTNGGFRSSVECAIVISSPLASLDGSSVSEATLVKAVSARSASTSLLMSRLAAATRSVKWRAAYGPQGERRIVWTLCDVGAPRATRESRQSFR